MDSETKRIINQIRKYRPSGVPNQVEKLSHVGEMWFLHLPTKMREAIDSSKYRLHKDRPWVCIAEYPLQNRYLFVACKSVHNDEDIDKYDDYVPFEFKGAIRVAVMTEQLILTKEDFKNSNPTYMGELDPWLISLMECVYAACSNFSSIDVDKNVVEELMNYVEWADPNVWTRSSTASVSCDITQENLPEQELDSERPSCETPEGSDEKLEVVTPSSKRANCKTVIDDTFLNMIREMIIGMVRSGKIKPQRDSDPEYNLNLLKHTKGMYNDDFIFIRPDVLTQILKSVNFKGVRCRVLEKMKKAGMIKTHTPQGCYQKTINHKKIVCIAIVIRDSDHIRIAA